MATAHYPQPHLLESGPARSPSRTIIPRVNATAVSLRWIRANTDTVNYYQFTLDREKSVRIVAEKQETDNAKLAVTDEEGNVVFKADQRGWYGTGDDKEDYYDQLNMRVIGPGIWNIRMKQTGPTDNTFNLRWDVEDAPVFPNDDYAAGIWTTGTVVIGGSKNGTIEHLVDRPGQDLNKRDNDWFAVELELAGQYEFTAVPSGMNPPFH